MKNKKLVFVLAATMLLAACGPKPAEGSSGADKPTSSVKSDGATSSNHKHSYGEWVTTKEPTCTEKGQKERTCECGEKQTQDIATVDHKYGEWKETKAPTCDADGEKERACTVCGAKETEAVKSTGHKWGETIYHDPTADTIGYRTAFCTTADKAMMVEFASLDGTWAQGSQNKSGTPDGYLKISKNDMSISYKFKFNRTGKGKIYAYGCMDYWDSSNSTYNVDRSFFNDGTPNFALTANGADVEITNTKTYGEMLTGPDASYSEDGLMEIGAIELVAGTNEVVMTRKGSYNPLIKNFVIVLDEYSDEVEEPVKEPDSWLNIEADNGIDTYWSDIYVDKASGNFYFVEQEELYDAKWVFEEGDKLVFNEIVTNPGYSVASVKVNGVEATATEVPDGRGTKTIYEATLTAAGEQKVEIKSVKDPDTFYTFTADAHVTAWVASFSGDNVDEYAVFNYNNPMTGEPMANKDSVEFVYAEDVAFMLSAVVEEGYEIDYIKIDGQSADVGDGGDGIFGIYAEVTSDGSHTVEIKTKEMPKPDSSLVLDFDEHVSEETYICLDHFNFWSEGVGYSAQWFYEEGEIMYIDPVFEDGYVLDEITVDGVKVTSEYDEDYEGYPVTLAAAGQHTVKITSKEDTDSTVSITADEHVAMFIGTIDNDDGDYGIMLDNENTSKAFKYADDQTWMIQAVAAEGYLIDTIKVNGQPVDFVSEDTGDYVVSCAMGMLESEGVYAIEITTKQAPDTKITVNYTDEVAMFQAMASTDEDDLAIFGYGTGEGESATSGEFIFEEGTNWMIQAVAEEGYLISAIKINGEPVEFETEDTGDMIVACAMGTIGAAGNYVISIETEQAPDAKVAFTADEKVTAFQAEICNGDDDTLGLINWGTGEGEVAVNAEFIYEEDSYMQAMVAVAEGYEIDKITVNGAAVEFVYDEDGEVYVFEYEFDEDGEYSVEIKTKLTINLGETGNGEVEEW